MAQFNSTSLARLIGEVRRETLSGALQEANLEQLLTSDNIETLRDLAGWLNLVENLLILGPSATEEAIRQGLRDFPHAPATMAALNLVSVFLDFFRFMPSITTLDNKLEDIIDAFEGLDLGKPLDHGRIVFELNLIRDLAGDIRTLDLTKAEMRARAQSIQDTVRALAPLVGVETWEV